jgi:hypothetical protein
MSKRRITKREEEQWKSASEQKEEKEQSETQALFLLIELVALAKNRQDYRPVLKELKEVLKKAPKIKRAIMKSLGGLDLES